MKFRASCGAASKSSFNARGIPVSSVQRFEFAEAASPCRPESRQDRQLARTDDEPD